MSEPTNRREGQRRVKQWYAGRHNNDMRQADTDRRIITDRRQGARRGISRYDALECGLFVFDTRTTPGRRQEDEAR